MITVRQFPSLLGAILTLLSPHSCLPPGRILRMAHPTHPCARIPSRGNAIWPGFIHRCNHPRRWRPCWCHPWLIPSHALLVLRHIGQRSWDDGQSAFPFSIQLDCLTSPALLRGLRHVHRHCPIRGRPLGRRVQGQHIQSPHPRERIKEERMGPSGE